MMAADDPWADLHMSPAADTVSARRVETGNPWDFFWGRDIEGRCLLLLKHTASLRGRLPRLREIELLDSTGGADGVHTLIFRLKDDAHRDIFHRLCLDIVSRARSVSSEEEAVSVTLARVWRWHHLLRGGSDGRMSVEEQKGLIGELIVLERYLLTRLSAFDAVNAWHGPQGAPKDFQIGQLCIEAKAKRGAAAPMVVINSEHQLDSIGTDALFLHVADLTEAPSVTAASTTVTEMAQRILDRIQPDESAAADYEGLLAAAGFRWEDDYVDSRFVIGACQLYLVQEAFPRIDARKAGIGVSNVRYSISLPACEPFQVSDGALEAALEEQLGN